MKKYPWLDALENASLIGLGVGSVASLLLKQILYTTAPLSILVLLSLLNRRQFEETSEQRDAALTEVTQKLSHQVDLLDQRTIALPTPEVIQQLEKELLQKNQEVAETLHIEIAAVRQGVHQCLTYLEQETLGSMQQDMDQLNDKYTYLLDGLTQLNADLGQLAESTQLDQVQTGIDQLKIQISATQTNLENLSYYTKPNLMAMREQIARLERQFSRLPPPVDASSLKQEVAELVKLMADLMPKRDLTALVSEMKHLHQQQEALKRSIIAIETAAVGFKSTFNGTPKSPSLAPDRIRAIAVAAGQCETQTVSEQEFNLATPGSVSSTVYPELQATVANYLRHLRSQLASIQEFTDDLAQQQNQLREHVSQLPQTLDVVALQGQLKELSRRIPEPEHSLNIVKSQIQEVLQQELHSINRLQPLPSRPQHELVFDFHSAQPHSEATDAGRAGSQEILQEALTVTQKRLILIWPWSDQCSLGEDLLQKLETFLSRRGQLDLGWCHLANRDEERLLGKMKRGWGSEGMQQDPLHDTLHKLLQLKRLYPDNLQFKILGTSENFLVSDQSFAVLGIADVLRTNTACSDLHLKLRTQDAGVIQRLIQRFDDPLLAADDLASYWNRAVTRYELGDKVGAIADYTQILNIQPEDALAYNHRGLCEYDLGNREAAIADFTRSIQLYPQQGAAYCNRAFIHYEQSQYQSAIDDYSQAIQTHPDWAIAYFYRGMVWQKRDVLEAAVADYCEAIRLLPSAAAYYYRGLAWQTLENYSEAIADLTVAAERFTAQGSKTNAHKALKILAKLQQEAKASPQTLNLEVSLSATTPFIEATHSDAVSLSSANW